MQINRAKREAEPSLGSGRPEKKIKTLLEDDDSSDNEKIVNCKTKKSFENGTDLAAGFKINEHFANRFEHNKKRAELHSLQEKYGDSILTGDAQGKETRIQDQVHGTESSSDSEEEDDAGNLVSVRLDKQIQTTLEAIRNKDPRVYDGKVTFYEVPEEEQSQISEGAILQHKPMYLGDYHRRNLLDERLPSDKVPHEARLTYTQEQDNLKGEVVKELHATFSNQNDSNGQDSENDGFMIQKPTTSSQKLEELNIGWADRDPEAFLSKFMSARAWVPSTKSQYHAFESDDEDEDRKAELFEEAYNLRFEDPNVSNEKLMSHARDAAAKYSVRKEAENPRRKARELERSKKVTAKQAREDEKARLRKLKVIEFEAKISQIKEAAGIRGQKIQDKDWSTFFEQGWDDANWEEKMKSLFGDDYYADQDTEDTTQDGSKHARKLKKPQWQDDIDIEDLVPGFQGAKTDDELVFSLTDSSEIGEAAPFEQSAELDLDLDESIIDEKGRSKQNKTKKPRTDRVERRKVEQIVDEQMNVDDTLANFGKKHSGLFRYRETSPTAYGLTSTDILMADDSQLNQYTGLKKMAAFRDPDKKRKDKKRLGKKARLRQWRKDTFGNEQGPQRTLAEMIAEHNDLRGAPYNKYKKRASASDNVPKPRNLEKAQANVKHRF